MKMRKPEVLTGNVQKFRVSSMRPSLISAPTEVHLEITLPGETVTVFFKTAENLDTLIHNLQTYREKVFGKLS